MKKKKKNLGKKNLGKKKIWEKNNFSNKNLRKKKIWVKKIDPKRVITPKGAQIGPKLVFPVCQVEIPRNHVYSPNFK